MSPGWLRDLHPAHQPHILQRRLPENLQLILSMQHLVSLSVSSWLPLIYHPISQTLIISLQHRIAIKHPLSSTCKVSQVFHAIVISWELWAYFPTCIALPQSGIFMGQSYHLCPQVTFCPITRLDSASVCVTVLGTY